MAQFSFDVISEVASHELTNALDQAQKEIRTRFDFKNTGTEIKHEENKFEIKGNSEGRVKAAAEVLKEKLVRRSISLKALSEGKIEPGPQSNFKQAIDIVHGINDEKARSITKFIKGLGVKAQAQIQGEQVRVSSKQKDELQKVMKALREEDFGVPLQFTNYR